MNPTLSLSVLKPRLFCLTAINLLLLPQLTPQTFRTVLQPNGDNGVLWQTFISALTGQKTGHGVSQMVSAVELARLKSVKLHFVRGEALNQIMKPAKAEDQPEQENDKELDSLKQVIALQPMISQQCKKWLSVICDGGADHDQ